MGNPLNCCRVKGSYIGLDLSSIAIYLCLKQIYFWSEGFGTQYKAYSWLICHRYIDDKIQRGALELKREHDASSHSHVKIGID